MAIYEKLFHGSNNRFDSFILDYSGTNGTAQGIGVYLSPNKDIARIYAQTHRSTGYIYEVNVKLENELSVDVRTISKEQLEAILSKLNEYKKEELLSNFGDINYEGFEAVIDNAVKTLFYNNKNDVDIYNDMVTITGDCEAVSTAFYEIGNYTHCIVHNQTRLNDEVIVVFNPNSIEIEKIEVFDISMDEPELER